MIQEHPAIAATRQWVHEVIIGERFCPFAKPVADANGIGYYPVSGESWPALSDALVAACQRLNQNPQERTSLLVITEGLEDFFIYLSALEMLEAKLNDWGYSGIYQLASFHPNYVFSGESETAVTNYTNRSPYPLYHLLREEDITALSLDEAKSEAIYQRNMTHAQRLGAAFFSRWLSPPPR